MGKLKTALNRKVDAQSVFAFLFRQKELLCAAAVCLFLASPLIEMVLCLLSRVERAYPIRSYPFVILCVVKPCAELLAAVVFAAEAYDAVRRRVSLSAVLRRHKAWVFFLLTVFWIILSSVVTKTMGMWFWGDMYRNEPLTLVVSYFLVFFYCASRIRSAAMKERIVLLSVIFSLILGLYSTLHMLFIAAGRDLDNGAVSIAVFANINHYGYYLAVHTMLCSGLFACGKKKAFRIIALAGLIGNTAFLSMNNSLGAWLACLLAFFFQGIALYLTHKRVDRRTLLALALFLLVTILLGTRTQLLLRSILGLPADIWSVLSDPAHADSAGSNRWVIWRFTAARIAEKPLFGFGSEGINAALKAETRNTRPHNELLQYAVFYGIPAAVLYAGGVMAVFLRGYRARARLAPPVLICLTAAFSYFVSSMFGNTMFYTAPFFFLFLGLGYHWDAEAP